MVSDVTRLGLEAVGLQRAAGARAVHDGHGDRPQIGVCRATGDVVNADVVVGVTRLVAKCRVHGPLTDTTVGGHSKRVQACEVRVARVGAVRANGHRPVVELTVDAHSLLIVSKVAPIFQLRA